MPSKVAVLCRDKIWSQHSKDLAKKLSLDLVSVKNNSYKAFLFFNIRGVLDIVLPLWTGNQTLFLDFSNKREKQFKQKAWSLKSLLPRALGVDKNRYSVLDITAGFCEDSFILSSLGVKVSSIEKSIIIFSLVQSALNINLSDPLRLNDQKPKFSLINQNSMEYMKNLVNLNQRPEVIYMDPMFEISSRKALSNKSMQVLQVLESYTEDLKNQNEKLLKQALNCASKRVVLKRHKKMPSLKKPSYTLEGKLVRYDVYLV